MQDHFGIAACAKDMTPVFKLRAQIKKIVQLAIKDQATGMIFVPDRLLTAGQIDDAKPAYAKENFASDPSAAFIRASMKKPFSGILSTFSIYLSAPDLAVNPTHIYWSAEAWSTGTLHNERTELVNRHISGVVSLQPGFRSIPQELIEFAAPVVQNLVFVFTCFD